MTSEQIRREVEESDLEDQPVYQGPQTQSCTKALMKANLVMNECFQIDDTFQLASETKPISVLIG